MHKTMPAHEYPTNISTDWYLRHLKRLKRLDCFPCWGELEVKTDNEIHPAAKACCSDQQHVHWPSCPTVCHRASVKWVQGMLAERALRWDTALVFSSPWSDLKGGNCHRVFYGAGRASFFFRHDAWDSCSVVRRGGGKDGKRRGGGSKDKRENVLGIWDIFEC